MATKKRSGNKEDETSNSDRQRNTRYSNDENQNRQEGSWRGHEDGWNGNGPDERFERGRYEGRNAGDYHRDHYDYRDQNFNGRPGDERWERENSERRSGYYPGGVQGNRNESRGEGYRGYGRQGEDGSNRAGERFDNDDRFYRDRGYSRDMYARNDRSYHWDDNDRRYREDNREAGNWRDGRMNRDDFYDNNNRYRDQSYQGGNRQEQAYNHGSRSGYGYDEFPDSERQGQRNERSNDNRNNDNNGQRRQRVVGRGMYGNNPSGRYGNYGDDTMHGNMGGGDWRGNNEYQVGGGAGYQPSDAGTYGSYSGAPDKWDEDQPPGRKSGAKSGERTISKRNQKNVSTNTNKNAAKNSTSGKTRNNTQKVNPGRGKKDNKNSLM